MIYHHALLEVLIAVLKDSFVKKTKETAEFLDNFQWELEKHLFAEEKVIFKVCRQEAPGACELVRKLEQEHLLMLEMLEDLKDNLIIKTEADFIKFHELLTKHRQLEEKELYPRLDQELNIMVKEDIIAKINEIPIKKTKGD